MNYSVIIPAAGQGKRMQSKTNKQFIHLDGQPVIAHTISLFQDDPACQHIIVVAHEKERQAMGTLAGKYRFSKVSAVVSGGKERHDSVYKGLKKLSTLVPVTDLILVHDGARPFIEIEAVHRLVKVASRTEAAILAVPVKDTIKSVSHGMVTKTLDRSQLWAVQTPQAFRLDILKQAYEHYYKHQPDISVTDDASLVEAMNRSISIVEGQYDNLKITTPEDVFIGEVILKRRKDERN